MPPAVIKLWPVSTVGKNVVRVLPGPARRLIDLSLIPAAGVRDMSLRLCFSWWLKFYVLLTLVLNKKV